jgi:hypothetical protein
MTSSPIRIVPESAPAEGGPSFGSSALRPDADAPVRIRFRIHAETGALEVLRQVRRSMLREESTLGRSEGEPAFADAVFSPDGIDWSVPLRQRAYCLSKIAALEARVSRALPRDPRVESAHP